MSNQIIGVVKMKKVISLLVASFMLLSSGVVNASELTKEQQTDLYSYGIMVGDENGDLRLNDSITRAEAVKMICCLGNIDITANDNHINDKYFKDIPQEHWAIKYINNAKIVGIIDGDENGNFNPDDEITYNEIIKMIVSVLGYNSMADSIGGYPNGYFLTATQLGLIKSLSIKNDGVALRNSVAILISNALDVPIMQQSSFGANIEYQIMNGKNGTKLITRRSLLDKIK